MANTHETIADIIAEKRKYADEIERKAQEYIVRSERVPGAYQSGIVYNIRSEADRLEAAYKREKAEWVNANAGLAKLVDIEKVGDSAKLREVISTLRTALKEIRNDVLDMVMNHKSEDPDSYAHGLCLSIGGACDMALNSTKEFDDADE